MHSRVADQRLEPSDETARLPSLPSSFLPESTADEAPDMNDTRPTADAKVAVLGPTLRFKGELTAQEDFILQGRIEGSVQQAQRIVIAADGVVIGSIHARVVAVEGNVEGDVHAFESVTIHKGGRVVGNIFAPRVALVEGALFNGRIDMSGAPVVERAPIQQAPIQLAPIQQAPMQEVSTQRVALVLPPPPVRRSIG